MICNWMDINVGATGRLHKHTICIHTRGIQDAHNMHMVDSIIVLHQFTVLSISQLFPPQFTPTLVAMDSNTSTNVHGHGTQYCQNNCFEDISINSLWISPNVGVSQCLHKHLTSIHNGHPRFAKLRCSKARAQPQR